MFSNSTNRNLPSYLHYLILRLSLPVKPFIRFSVHPVTALNWEGSQTGEKETNKVFCLPHPMTNQAIGVVLLRFFSLFKPI
ncbi:MAG: hypothetical protein ACI9XK_000919 [Granulosicoccus sp.]|jgi:hypothetical protein